jgi:hypothetical protein
MSCNFSFDVCLWPLSTIAKEASQLVYQEILHVPTTNNSFQVVGHVSGYDDFGAGNMQGLANLVRATCRVLLKLYGTNFLSWFAFFPNLSFGSVGHVGDVKE